MRWPRVGEGGSRPSQPYNQALADEVVIVGKHLKGDMFGCKAHKQNTLKNTWFGNAREKVGKVITNMFNAYGVSANVAEGP